MKLETHFEEVTRIYHEKVLSKTEIVYSMHAYLAKSPIFPVDYFFPTSFHKAVAAGVNFAFLSECMADVIREIQRELRREKYPPYVWKLRLWASVLIALLTAVVLAEIFCRLTRIAPSPILPSAHERLGQHVASELNTYFKSNAFVSDPYLLWKHEPASWFLGHRISNDGLYMVPPSISSSPDSVVKVLVLGDALPTSSPSPFPDVLQRLATARESGKNILVWNAAVPAYSIEQISRLWEKVRRLQSFDVVVVCAGWADSSPAFGVEDRYLGIRHPFLARLWNELNWMHLYRAMLTQSARGETSSSLSMRVSPSHFEDSLRRLVTSIRRANAVPILLTEPHDPPEDIHDETARELLERHQQYNAIIRRVAIEEHVVSVDLEQEFQRRGGSRLWQSPGMVLSPPGHNLAARLILGALCKAGLFSEEDLGRMARNARYDTMGPDRPRVKWHITPDVLETETTAGKVCLSVIATNTGNTAWLRRRTIKSGKEGEKISFGSTAIRSELRYQEKHATDETSMAVAERFPLPHDVFPGEATSQTLCLSVPNVAGDYVISFCIDVDGIGSLTRFGAEECTVSLSLR